MVFYVDPEYERACRDYWESSMTDSDKDAWRAFLTELRYNANDETLVVNELQAYMATERVMFDDGVGGNKGGGNNGGKGGEKIETLARMQREFARTSRRTRPWRIPRPWAQTQRWCGCDAGEGGGGFRS